MKPRCPNHDCHSDSLKGITKRVMVPAHRVKLFPETVKGLTRTVKGLTETVKLPRQTVNLFAQTVKHLTRTVKLPQQTVKGLTRTVKLLTETVKLPQQTVKLFVRPVKLPRHPVKLFAPPFFAKAAQGTPSHDFPLRSSMSGEGPDKETKPQSKHACRAHLGYTEFSL